MLEATNLTLHYGGSQILHGIDIAARPGSVTCVMGNNGVGKTSLMNLLAGRHQRSGGDIAFDGKPLGRVTAQQMARLGVGYVPQGRAIFPMLTVRENLDLAAKRFAAPPGGWTMERVMARPRPACSAWPSRRAGSARKKRSGPYS